jgi:hypothetical protein
MKTTPYPVRLPKHLLDLADLRAAEERLDRSTALRQLLYSGAEEYVLDLLSRGRISLSKAAELLDTSALAIVEKARERDVTFGASAELYAKARTRARRAGRRR